MSISLCDINEKKLALLVDPDKFDKKNFTYLLNNGLEDVFSFVFVGGSLFVEDLLDEVIKKIKSLCQLPIILFPGSSLHVSRYADGILFLSLVSGRNPEFLIGNQVIAAPKVKKHNLSVFSTGYLLIDGGCSTTAHYISNTLPIPAHKPEIAAVTALTAEMIGMKNIYLDCGSGAAIPVSKEMVQAVKKAVSLPIIVGGGISSIDKINNLFGAGANVLVLGNVLEKKPSFIKELQNQHYGTDSNISSL